MHKRFMHRVGTPLSLVGQLHHASAVIKPGRTFLRCLIDLSTTVTKLHHHICLTNPTCSDGNGGILSWPYGTGSAIYVQQSLIISLSLMLWGRGVVWQSGSAPMVPFRVARLVAEYQHRGEGDATYCHGHSYMGQSGRVGQ